MHQQQRQRSFVPTPHVIAYPDGPAGLQQQVRNELAAQPAEMDRVLDSLKVRDSTAAERFIELSRQPGGE